MAKSPVTLAPQENLACGTCNGTSMIFRPEADISHVIELREYHEYSGDMMTKEHSVVTRTGGIDACPVCAALAKAKQIIDVTPDTKERRRDLFKVVKLHEH